jgi:hypothetical protein
MPDWILRTRDENRRRRCSLLVLSSPRMDISVHLNGPEIAESWGGAGLRGLVQRFLSPRRFFGDLSET